MFLVKVWGTYGTFAFWEFVVIMNFKKVWVYMELLPFWKFVVSMNQKSNNETFHHYLKESIAINCTDNVHDFQK